jgi:CubicO group peptidase (beta-lactamase class C family)
MTTVDGHCAPEFQRLEEIFRRNLEQGLDVGASLAVTLDGELVVDLWGGIKDQEKGTAWERDTIVLVFSTTKIFSALCGLMLIDQGRLDPDAPIADYWPEFAVNGKEKVLVRHAFTHSAGVPAYDPPIPFSTQYDWAAITVELAKQKPMWEPGTTTGYHGSTFGVLIGELVRRVTGQTIGQYLREEVTSKLGIDLCIGATMDEVRRMGTMIPTDDREEWGEPDSIGYRADHTFLPPEWDTLECLTCELPSGNGMANGRSLAQLGSVFALNGEVGGHRFLQPETIDLMLTEQFYDTDLVVSEPVRFGFGMGLNSAEFPCPSESSLHWGGAGGSFMVADRQYRAAIGYAMNFMRGELLGDPRTDPMREAFNDILRRG